MNLERWWPVVTKAVIGGNALAIHVVFWCPFCHRVIFGSPSCHVELNFETSGHIISAGQHELLLEWKFKDIIKPKSCPVCGIVSTLPEKDKVKLFEDIRTIVTVSWLDQKSEEKDPQNPVVSPACFTCSSV